MAKRTEHDLAEVERERDAAESVCKRLDDKLARALLAHETLTAALERYGRHLDDCDRVSARCGPCDCACSCGFDQARGGG